MARPRTPTNVLAMRGAFKKNPQRARTGEPEGDGSIGDAPEHLSKEQKEVWKEVVDTCHLGVLCRADRIALEILVVLLLEWRLNPMEFSAGMLTRLDSLLGRFGMTPADRSKVKAPEKAKENPFSALVRKEKKAG